MFWSSKVIFDYNLTYYTFNETKGDEIAVMLQLSPKKKWANKDTILCTCLDIRMDLAAKSDHSRAQ